MGREGWRLAEGSSGAATRAERMIAYFNARVSFCPTVIALLAIEAPEAAEELAVAEFILQFSRSRSQPCGGARGWRRWTAPGRPRCAAARQRRPPRLLPATPSTARRPLSPAGAVQAERGGGGGDQGCSDEGTDGPLQAELGGVCAEAPRRHPPQPGVPVGLPGGCLVADACRAGGRMPPGGWACRGHAACCRTHARRVPNLLCALPPATGGATDGHH